MADGVRVSVRGKDKLARKLNALAPAALKELTDANYKLAADMVADAQRFVPVVTGTLKNSIRWEPAGLETGAARVLAGGPATTRPVRSGASRSYDYAIGVEFGTSDTPAEPYFFPSYRLVKRKHKSRASRALNTSIRKVAAK